MVKVNILKSGLFAFEGVHVRMMKKGPDDLTQKWADQICATTWAEFEDGDKEPAVEPVTEVATEVDDSEFPEIGTGEPDWELVEEIDEKGMLDDYAKDFGVNLDRRKSLDKMKAAFKAEFE